MDWCVEKGIHFRPHVIETSSAVCIERAVSGGRPDLVPVIKRMAAETDIEAISWWWPSTERENA